MKNKRSSFECCMDRDGRPAAPARAEQLQTPRDASQLQTFNCVEGKRPGSIDFHLPPHAEHVLRVLIVDDNRDAADSMALLVKTWGYEVTVAYDGVSALTLASDCVPDVVLLDIGLPRLDGFEVAEQILQQAALKGVLLIAVSGHTDEAHRVRSRKVGFSEYMVKPADPFKIQTLLKVRQGLLGKNSHEEVR